MTKNEMLLEITKTLRQHPSVRVAYLFGSMARGTEREGSDIDVAVWFDSKLSQIERFQERLSILADLNGRLDRSIDCIDLDSSDPHLVHQVFTDRILLLSVDEEERIEREVAARRNYWDKLPYAEEYSRCLAERRKHQTSKSPSHAPGA